MSSSKKSAYDTLQYSLKDFYNSNLTDKIGTSIRKAKEIPLGLDENIKRMKKVVDDYSRKDINLGFIDRFTRMIYANPFHLAKLEFLQYIVFIGLIYFYNPFNISTKYPAFTKLLILSVSFAYVMLFIFIKMKVEKGDDVDLIEPTESNVIKQIISIVVFFVLFMLAIKGIIWLLVNTALVHLFRQLLGLVLVVIVLGIVYLYMRKKINKIKDSPGRKFSTLVLKVIMYLPCLLVDIVEYVKYELNLTTKPVWILLGAEGVLAGLFFIVPFLFDKIMTVGGTKMLNQPVYLSEEHTLGNLKQQTGDDKLTSIDQLYSTDQPSSDDDVSNKELSNVYTDPNVPKNAVLAWIYDKLKHPTLLKVDFTKHPQYTDANSKQFKYAYSLSGWFYINPQPPNTNSAYTKYTNILRYGNKVKVEFNGQLGSLRVMGDVADTSQDSSSNNTSVEIFETKHVLYQRWNNIVINYEDGYLDVFLNGDLVGSLSGVVPYMSFESIVAGSAGGIMGGICNVSYYDKPQSKSDIRLTYKALSAKNQPYIWSLKDEFNINIKSTGINRSFINQMKNSVGIST